MIPVRPLLCGFSMLTFASCRAPEDRQLPSAAPRASAVASVESGGASPLASASAAETCKVQSLSLCEAVRKVADGLVAHDFTAFACAGADDPRAWSTRIQVPDATECHVAFSRPGLSRGRGAFGCSFEQADLHTPVRSEDELLAHQEREGERIGSVARQLSECGALKSFDTAAELARFGRDGSTKAPALYKGFLAWTADKRVGLYIVFEEDRAIPEMGDPHGRLAERPHRPRSRLSVSLQLEGP